MIDFIIYSPSYKRPELCKSHKYLSQVTYVVGEAEGEAYKNVHDKVWVVPDAVQGNLCRVRNYILDNAPEDVQVIIIDDDIDYFGRWNGNVDVILDEQGAYNMMQEGCLLADDMDVRFWGLNCLKDKGAYREYTPFGTKHYIGGPFQAHRNNECRYDEVIFLKEDYDMTLQVLRKYRKNLRLNMYHYMCNQADLEGGCATYRNLDRERLHNEMLREKWGGKIVKFDTSNKSKEKEKIYDINPVIKVPIKGV